MSTQQSTISLFTTALKKIQEALEGCDIALESVESMRPSATGQSAVLCSVQLYVPLSESLPSSIPRNIE